jgi:methylated-DNA-[protein]-cysteine S-methyltransferase
LIIMPHDTLVTFPTALGWIAMIGRGKVLEQLTLAHPSKDAAIAALDGPLLDQARVGRWNPPLVRRLQAYARGAAVRLDDIPVDPGPLGPFARRVVALCRKIPAGKTVTYAELARLAGSPRAARAVGNCMAKNRIPLVIPCHRVVPAGKGIGNYSAPGGAHTKRRLLALESAPLK